jgi:magnesium-transporting ATPase (P-type)
MSTTIARGRAKGIVVRTGSKTEVYISSDKNHCILMLSYF